MPKLRMSARRCEEITCTRCARRYSNQVARGLLRSAQGIICAVTFDTGITTSNEFAKWRVSIRNTVHYRRTYVSNWWDSFSLYLCLSNDGYVRGIVSMGSVTEDELISALGARWPITLHRISRDTLCDELYSTIRPDVILTELHRGSRYQHVKLAIRERKRSKRPILPASVRTSEPFYEPMPIIL